MKPASTFLVLLIGLAGALAADPIAVRGLVRAPDGGGLAGARVELLSLPANFETNRRILAGEASPPSAVGSTDAHGRFSLAAPEAGVWKVVVTADGFVPMQAAPIPAADAVELAPVSLTRDAGAAVQVRDGKGAPIAGAAVYAVTGSQPLWRELTADGWRPASRLGRTDAAGRVVLPRARGEKLVAAVFPPGGAVPRRAELEAAAEVRLPADSSVAALQVRDPRGAPVAGVLVCVGELAWPAGVTDARGELRVRGRLPGTMKLLLLAPDGRARSATLDPTKLATAVVLADPVRLAGRVVGEPAGESREPRPVAGALVWSGLDPGAFVRTDERGGYAVLAPDDPRPWFQAEAAGFLPRRGWAEKEDLAARRAPVLTLALPAAVSGRVVDVQGKPVPGVRIGAAGQPPGAALPFFRPDRAEARAVSGLDGSFRIAPLRPGTAFELTAERRAYAPATVAVERLAAGKTREGVRIVMTPVRPAFGRVVDREGLPLPGVEVLLRRARPREEVRPAGLEGLDEAAPFTAATSAEGRFVLDEIPAPRIDLTARKEGYAPVTVRGIVPPPGQGPADLGTIVLEPAASIEGRAIDGERRGVAGVRVWSSPQSLGPTPHLAMDRLEGREADAVTGADGGFRVSGLAPGVAVHLYFHKPGLLPAAVPAVTPPPARPLEVVLRPAGRIAGRVVGDEDEGLAGAEVSIRPQEARLAKVELPRLEEHLSASAGEGGEFVIEGVPPGLYEVEAFAAGYQPSAPVPLRLALGEEADGLLFDLERGAILQGRVVTSAGEPVAGARILVGRPSATSDAEGRYQIEGIPAGRQTAEARHRSYNRVVREIEVEPGRNSLDFTFEEGHPVRGRVLDTAGEPLPGVTVSLRLGGSRDFREHRAVTGREGGFAFEHVADGDYDLLAEKPGYAGADLRPGARVAGGPVEKLEVRLEEEAILDGRITGLGFREMTEVQVEVEGGGRTLTGTIDFDGRYEVRGLGQGDWRVRAWLRSGSRQAEARFTIRAGMRRVRKDLDFGQGVTLTGQVLYGREPLADGRVTLDGEDVAADRLAVADHQGRFRVEDLRPGRYRLGVSHPREMVVHNEELELFEDRDVLIEIAAARVAGRVVAGTREEPVAEARVSLRQLLGPEGGREASLFSTVTDAAGAFGMPRVPPGRYRATVQREGYALLERMLNVPVTGVEDLRLELEPTAGLEVALRLASGSVPAAAAISVLDPSGRILLTERRALEDGRARLASVPPGSWSLLVSAPGGAVTAATAAVPGDPVVLTLADAAPLRVRVPALFESGLMATLAILGRDGQPLLAVDPVTGQPVREWRVAAGIAVAEGVPAGAWTVSVTASDGQTWRREVATSGRMETRITLE